MQEPVQIIKYQCPICKLEGEYDEIKDHLEFTKDRIIIPKYVSEQVVKIKNQRKGTYSLAKIAFHSVSENHNVQYHIKGKVFFKDYDHFPQDLEGEVFREYEILSDSDSKNYVWDQERTLFQNNESLKNWEIYVNTNS